MSKSPPTRVRRAFRNPVSLLTERFPRLRRAQGLVEFALVLPALLMVIFVVVDVARTFQAYLVVDNASRMAMRFAVTGEFDTSHCVDLDGPPLDPCAGDDRHAEEDAARMGTIFELVEESLVGIMRDPTATWGQPGYFHTSVCSTRTGNVWDPLQRYSDTVPGHDSRCLPHDDAGSPDEGVARVIVGVTFENPIIMPILSSFIPSVTLHSERSGILEQYRVARVIGLPPDIVLPSATPSNTPTASLTPTNTPTPTNTYTPTPSDTPTPTNTPTPSNTPSASPSFTPTPSRTPSNTPTMSLTPSATPCKVKPIAVIIQPGGGSYSTTLPAEVTAFDPDNVDPLTCAAGSGANGLGINRVTMDFQRWTGSAWSTVYSVTDTAKPYCGFGGSCSSLNILAGQWPNGVNILTGSYRLRARARDDENVWSAYVYQTFSIVAPNTPTASLTPTPTRTFTPSPIPPPSNTPVPTATRTNTPSRTPTSTRTPTATRTFTPTPSKTLTPSLTYTPSKTLTPSLTFTPSKTLTPSKTPTATSPFTPTPSRTPTPTKSPTPTATNTPTQCFDC